MSSSNELANEYGRAYFMLTEELSLTEAAKSDVHVLQGVLSSEKKYLPMLDTPALSKEERLALIDEAFGSLNEYLVNLIKLLAEKRYAYLLPRTLDVFLSLCDEAQGIERVEAITAVAMTEEQISRLTARLEAKTGKTVIISNTIDPSLLGGVKLRYMGVQLDGSLKSRLDGLAKGLRDAVV